MGEFCQSTSPVCVIKTRNGPKMWRNCSDLTRATEVNKHRVRLLGLSCESRIKLDARTPSPTTSVLHSPVCFRPVFLSSVFPLFLLFLCSSLSRSNSALRIAMSALSMFESERASEREKRESVSSLIVFSVSKHYTVNADKVMPKSSASWRRADNKEEEEEEEEEDKRRRRRHVLGEVCTSLSQD